MTQAHRFFHSDFTRALQELISQNCDHAVHKRSNFSLKHGKFGAGGRIQVNKSH